MEKVTFKTRISKDGAVVSTAASINWEGVTKEQMQELASRSVIIAQQAIYRTSGVIPATDTIEVAALLKREKGTLKLDTPEARAAAFTRLVAKMTPAELAQLQNQMRGK
jgi:hypothetical protein